MVTSSISTDTLWSALWVLAFEFSKAAFDVLSAVSSDKLQAITRPANDTILTRSTDAQTNTQITIASPKRRRTRAQMAAITPITQTE